MAVCYGLRFSSLTSWEPRQTTVRDNNYAANCPVRLYLLLLTVTPFLHAPPNVYSTNICVNACAFVRMCIRIRARLRAHARTTRNRSIFFSKKTSFYLCDVFSYSLGVPPKQRFSNYCPQNSRSRTIIQLSSRARITHAIWHVFFPVLFVDEYTVLFFTLRMLEIFNWDIILYLFKIKDFEFKPLIFLFCPNEGSIVIRMVLCFVLQL